LNKLLFIKIGNENRILKPTKSKHWKTSVFNACKTPFCGSGNQRFPSTSKLKIFDSFCGQKIETIENRRFRAFEISNFDASNASRLNVPKIHRIFEEFFGW